MKYVTYVAFSMMFLVTASTVINANACYEDCTNNILAGSEGTFGSDIKCQDYNDEDELIAEWPCPTGIIVFPEDGGCVPNGDIAEEGFMCKAKTMITQMYTGTCGETKDDCKRSIANPNVPFDTFVKVPCP